MTYVNIVSGHCMYIYKYQHHSVTLQIRKLCYLELHGLCRGAFTFGGMPDFSCNENRKIMCCSLIVVWNKPRLFCLLFWHYLWCKFSEHKLLCLYTFFFSQDIMIQATKYLSGLFDLCCDHCFHLAQWPWYQLVFRDRDSVCNTYYLLNPDEPQMLFFQYFLSIMPYNVC